MSSATLLSIVFNHSVLYIIHLFTLFTGLWWHQRLQWCFSGVLGRTHTDQKFGLGTELLLFFKGVEEINTFIQKGCIKAGLFN